jgi:hypothetical protein
MGGGWLNESGREEEEDKAVAILPRVVGPRTTWPEQGERTTQCKRAVDNTSREGGGGCITYLVVAMVAVLLILGVLYH